MNLSRRN